MAHVTYKDRKVSLEKEIAFFGRQPNRQARVIAELDALKNHVKENGLRWSQVIGGPAETNTWRVS